MILTLKKANGKNISQKRKGKEARETSLNKTKLQDKMSINFNRFPIVIFEFKLYPNLVNWNMQQKQEHQK